MRHSARRGLVLALTIVVAACRPSAPMGTDGSCGSVRTDFRARKRLGGSRLSLGVVADLNGSPATMANLERFVAQFRERHVDVMVALGDLGTNEDEIARVLMMIGKVGVPVLAVAGEHEPEAAFHAAVARAQSGGVDVVDMVSKRLVDTGHMDIVSVPGHPAATSGCRYTAADLTALREATQGRWRPMILLTHTPPKGEGAGAVDWQEEHNAGDPAILDLINALYPNVALFAHADDAGGRVQRTWINVGGVASGMATTVDVVDGLPRQHVMTVKD